MAHAFPRIAAPALLLPLLAALSITAPACSRKSTPPPPEPAQRAQETPAASASALDASATPPPAPVASGSPLVGPRPVELAITWRRRRRPRW